MIRLAVHEARMLGRRGVWPAALVMHALATSLFVGLWAQTGGVPLWQASLLQQLAAFDRLVIATVLTWFATVALADDERGGRNLVEWSAVCGRPAPAILRARVAAMAALTLVFLIVAAPAFVAAADISAAGPRELAADAAAVFGFACFALGVTAAARVAVRDRVAVWCIAMAVSGLASVGVRLLASTALRAAAPAVAGIVLLALAPSAVRRWRLANAD